MWRCLMTTYDRFGNIMCDRYCFFAAMGGRGAELAHKKTQKMAEELEAAAADLWIVSPDQEETDWIRLARKNCA